ncbi:MAG: twin-arginine translocase TatA/TatE family subunit [Armatimonadota bacterium]
MPGLPGGSEWILIGLVVLLLFGGEKLPSLMRGIGKGVGELKAGLEDGKRKLQDAMEEAADQKGDTH